MARKPANFQWLGFTVDQLELLGWFDFIGNNGWTRTPQTEALMPAMLAQWEAAGGVLSQLTAAMTDIGYGPRTVHKIER